MSLEKPRYSVLIPAYNAEGTIVETLASVQSQTMPDWEAVVVDDGSTDSTAALVRAIADKDARVRLVSQANGGTGAALDTAGRNARGTWHLFLGADDLLLPEYMERMDQFIGTHAGYDIYSCNAWYLFEDGSRQLMWRGPRFEREFSLTVEDQIRESSIVAMTVFSPRIWELTGGHTPGRHAEDYDLWLRALAKGAKHIYNPETLAVYRRRAGQKSRQLVENAMGFLEHQRAALDIEELTAGQRALLEAAVRFSEARVGRRRLEERLLSGETANARRDYWRYRLAFPGKAQYLLGLLIMLVSPGTYARIKRSRMS